MNPVLPGVLSGQIAGSGPDDVSPATTVLLIEDDDGDAFLVQELLLDVGYAVDLRRASTMAEALAALPGDIECVLLDLGLPDASELAGLRTVLEKSASIAVLVLTGLADEHRGTEAVAAGAQDYLVKGSIDGQLLTRAIRYAIERKRADESVRRLFASEARAAENARLERGLLPQPIIRSGWCQVVPRYRPGRHQSLLGGDFYDVVEGDDGVVFALIGDVAGHGPDEAALGVCLRIAWRTLVLTGAAPDTFFPVLDAVLVSERSTDEVFATVSMVRLDPTARSLTTWRAGHPLPLLLDGDHVTAVSTADSGVALGVLDGMSWSADERPLGEHTALLLFTDGLIEGFADEAHTQRLGEPALYQLLEDLLARRTPYERLGDEVLVRVQERNGGELSDDVAVVLLHWRRTGDTS